MPKPKFVLVEDQPKTKLSDDDYVDFSKWQGFLNTEVVYFNNATINQMIDNLHQELADRVTDEGEQDANS